VHTIRFCSVVFGVTSCLAVIHIVIVYSARARLVALALKNHGDGDFIARGTWWSNVYMLTCLQHLACCSVNSRHIGSESRFLPTPPVFDAPVRGVRVGISPLRLTWIN